MMENIKLYIGAALVAVAFLGGWFFNGYRWEAKMNALKTEYATTLQKTTEEAKEKEEASAAAIAAIDDKHTKELSNARSEIDRLRASVDAGSVRLRVNAKCRANVSQAKPGSVVGDATGPELDGDARQNYFALRAGIEQVTAQLNACQDIIRHDRAE